MQHPASLSTSWWIGGILALIYLSLGFTSLSETPYTGYLYGPGYEVTQVLNDSPAERAGLRVGDRLERVGGIDVNDRTAFVSRPRTAIGASTDLVIERDGSVHHLNVTLAPQPTSRIALFAAAAVIGFAFLIAGLWAHARLASPATRALAFAGVMAPAIFTGAPYVASSIGRLMLGALVSLAGMLFVASLAHFQLAYPNAPPRRKIATALLYGPVLLVGAALLATAPSPALQSKILPAFYVVLLAIVAALLALTVRNWWKADPASRQATGMNLLVGAMLLGLLPGLTASFARTLPGANYYFLTMVLIPVALAWAADRAAHHPPSREVGAHLAAPSLQAT